MPRLDANMEISEPWVEALDLRNRGNLRGDLSQLWRSFVVCVVQ